MKRKGAVELSVSTVVIVVLAMTMLILGTLMVKNIFDNAKSLIDMSDEQIRAVLIKTYLGDEENPIRLMMHPSSRKIELKIGEREQVGFGIVNKVQGPAARDAQFSYEIEVDDPDLKSKCDVTEAEVLKWLATGRSSSALSIPPGNDQMYIGRAMLQIPDGAVPCTFRFKVEVKNNGDNYATDYMDITIRA